MDAGSGAAGENFLAADPRRARPAVSARPSNSSPLSARHSCEVHARAPGPTDIFVSKI
jgi:hypothetical protein